MTGLLLGLSVSFRLPNHFLAAGPILVLSMETFKTLKPVAFLPLVVFGAAYLVGLTPTLVANAINAASPISTTYGPSDIVPLDLSFAIAKDYIFDMQGVVNVAASNGQLGVCDYGTKSGVGRRDHKSRLQSSFLSQSPNIHALLFDAHSDAVTLVLTIPRSDGRSYFVPRQLHRLTTPPGPVLIQVPIFLGKQP